MLRPKSRPLPAKRFRCQRHPFIVIAAADIVSLLRAHDLGSPSAVSRWLDVEFPDDQVVSDAGSRPRGE
jgi:hypothetical protein